MCDRCPDPPHGEQLFFVSHDVGYLCGYYLAEQYRQQSESRPANRCRIFTCKHTVPADGICWYCPQCYEKLEAKWSVAVAERDAARAALAQIAGYPIGFDWSAAEVMQKIATRALAGPDTPSGDADA